ncbi:FAD/NAD(P)-binding protein [Xenorhabdus sp. Flor]|uniref:FAD/NAD(P)-binding protein n=1 Tax=Xenorhabdus cabanillasii TaxID=351673 RepID=UPI0019B29853|nr:FAD/NAD(P)-binding protein [Xenorhabdus sp. Flor]MBD2813432.1 FAD/NAD(P)-binding protein [Xenorhabdus sp. Flor]
MIEEDFCNHFMPLLIKKIIFLDKQQMFDIAIVGLGATGVSLLSQIQDEVYNLNITKPNIAVFNPSSSFAIGKAFGDADHLHKMNTPPWMMSVSGMEPNKFKYWLNSLIIQEEQWPARLQYSQFIRQTYDDIIQSGVLNIDEYYCNVTTIIKNKEGFILTDEEGNTITTRKVVMCLGAQSADLFPEFYKKLGFIRHYSQFDQNAETALIIAGSSLTAIDAFRFAWTKGRGNIHLYSRNGYAPTCLTKENRYTPIYLHWRNIVAASKNSGNVLNTFTHLLRKEYNALGRHNEYNTAMKLLRTGKQQEYFSYLLNRSEGADLPWQDVLVSTRPYMHKLWNAMTIHQRQQFIKQYGAFWASWRHPIPQEVFLELIYASTDGRLKFHQSTSVPQYNRGQFMLQTSQEIILAPRFWDGTGGSQDINKINVPILQNLLEKKLIEAHPCGGINVDPMTYQCQVAGKSIHGLYNLGPLNKGALFSTNAFWFNSRCAENWAKQWALECNINNKIMESL